MGMQRFGNEQRNDDRWQGRQRRQGGAEIVRRQAQLAGVRRQPALVVRRMPDGMRPRRQLCEEKDDNEKEMA